MAAPDLALEAFAMIDENKMKPQTEALLVTARDQGLETKYFEKKFTKTLLEMNAEHARDIPKQPIACFPPPRG